MANILVVVPPHFGHINPTLGVGAELIQRGHCVTWVGFRDIPQSYFPSGGQYFVPESFASANDTVAAILERQDEASGITGNKMIRWAFESTWIPFAELTMSQFPSVLEHCSPDLVIHDEGLFGVALLCHSKGVPYVTSISSVPGLYYPPAAALLKDDADWLASLVAQMKQRFGIQAHHNVFNSDLVNLVYTSRSFVFGEKFPAHYQFVGPALDGRPTGAEVDWTAINTRRKVIYVSTGSLLEKVKHKFYQKVVDAFAGEDITVLLTCSPELFDQWPENFIARTRWPQLDVIAHVDAVVTAGGFNTINETLYFDTPMLVIPLANDQFGNAELIAKHGAGIKLRFRRLTAEKLKVSVYRLLNEVQFKQSATQLGIVLRESGGGIAAADSIEQRGLQQ